MVTIAGQAPENLYHVVLDNGVYAVTGGQPIPNAGRFSFAGLAAAAGYASAYEFDDLERLVTSIDEVLDAAGPVLVSVKTVPEVDYRAMHLRPSRRIRGTAESMRDVSQALSR